MRKQKVHNENIQPRHQWLVHGQKMQIPKRNRLPLQQLDLQTQESHKKFTSDEQGFNNIWKKNKLITEQIELSPPMKEQIVEQKILARSVVRNEFTESQVCVEKSTPAQLILLVFMFCFLVWQFFN